MKLKAKLLITYLIIVTIPPIVIFGFNYYSIKQSFLNIQQVSLEEIADLKVIAIENYFSEFKKDENIVQEYFNIKTNLPVLDKFKNDTTNSKYIAATAMLDAQLSAWRENHPIVRDIMLFNLDNEHLYSVNSAHWAKHKGEPLDAYYQIALEKGREGVYLGNIFKESILTNGYPYYFLISSLIYDFNNKPTGLVIMEVSTENVFSLIQDTKGLGTSGETLIGEPVGDKIIFLNPLRHDPDAALTRTVRINDMVGMPIQMALKNNNGSGILIDYRDEKVLAVWRYIPSKNWGLVAKIDFAEVMVPVRALEYISLLIGIIGLILASLFTWFFARYFSRPVEILVKDIRKVEKGDFEAMQFNGLKERNDEIGVLSRTFRDMVNALRIARENLERKVQERTKDLEKFKLAVENASDHIIITDTDGTVLYANKAVETITGYSQKKIIGKKAGQLWGGQMPKEFYVKMWDTIKNKKKDFNGEITNRHKNGKKYEARIGIAPILNNKNEVIFFVGLEQDITKEKNIDRTKTEFVSLASHQLRTPLTAIKWYIESLLEDLNHGLDKKQKEYLAEISNSNERMIELVNSLLNVSRIEMGSLAVEPVLTNIVELVDNVIKEVGTEMRKKKIKFSREFAAELPKIILDPKLARLVIQNILSNAIHYTPKGGKIVFSIKKEKTNLLLTVADNGYGIPKSQQDRIFTKFFRADNAVKKVPGGTGLGLYIAKAVVDVFKGRIWFDSKENKGTSFYINIPIKALVAKKGTKGLLPSPPLTYLIK